MTDDPRLFSDTPEEKFLLVKNDMETTEDFCPIAIYVNKGDQLLHILLGNFPAPDVESEKQAGNLRENSRSRLLELIESRKVRKMKITSDNFNYDDKPSLSFLLNLLLNIEKTKEFEFLAQDEREILVQPLSVLMYAALKDSSKMRKIALNLSYYDFPRRDFIKVLGNALSGAPKLQELALETHVKTIPFARIFNGLMNGRREWTKSLQRLGINCYNFNRKTTFLEIFYSFPNLKHLRLIAHKIKINDKILLRTLDDPTMIQKFETLGLSLRNCNITNYAVSQFFRRDFENLRELKLEFGGSSITDEAFDGIVYHGMKNFNPAINLEFDLQDTKATQKCYRTIKYFLNLRLNGPDDDGEASVRVLRRRNDYEKMSDHV